MNSSIFGLIENTALYHIIQSYFYSIIDLASDSISKGYVAVSGISDKSDVVPLVVDILYNITGSVRDTLNFNDFQGKLLVGFGTFLVINIFLIAIAWLAYGKLICDRFMKPATSRAIEELRASVSRLKLPKEHTPRL